MYSNDKVKTKSNDNSRYWHSYGLQRLSGSRFLSAVDDILDNRSILISPRGQKKIGSIPELTARHARLARI